MSQAWPQIWDDGQERMGTELHLEMAPDKVFSWAFTFFWSAGKALKVTCPEEAIKTYFGDTLVR